MPVSLTCTNCGEAMVAADEDALVAVVQAHVQGHVDAQAQQAGHQPGQPGHAGHRISREHVLRRLRRQSDQAGHQQPTGPAQPE